MASPVARPRRSGNHQQGGYGCDVPYPKTDPAEHPVAGIQKVEALDLDGQARSGNADPEQKRGQGA